MPCCVRVFVFVSVSVRVCARASTRVRVRACLFVFGGDMWGREEVGGRARVRIPAITECSDRNCKQM